jgi:hypothetical protein
LAAAGSAAEDSSPSADEIEGPGDEEVLEIPPEDALPASAILAKLEAQGYAQIIEAEFEDGVWEVTYVRNGEELELNADPITGEVVTEEQEEADEE